MSKEEIIKYINLSRYKCVCVEVRLAPEFPGFVRSIIIKPHNIVRIEFDSYGIEEGGIYYTGKYPSLDALVESLENYLSVPLEKWENCTKTGSYPEVQQAANMLEGQLKIAKAVETRSVPLPKESLFTLQTDY